MTLALMTAVTEGVGWAEIAIAAIGGGGIGGIVGGYIQVVKRGRIERAEAWRTRLIDATDGIENSISEVFRTFDADMLRRMAEGRAAVFQNTGEPSGEAAEIIYKTQEQIRVARASVNRLQLLYGRGSALFFAMTTVDCLRLGLDLVSEKDDQYPAISAILATQDNPPLEELTSRDAPNEIVVDPTRKPPRELLRRTMLREESTDWWVGRALDAVQHSEVDVPADFDPDDDRSRAGWALMFRAAANDQYNRFVDACVDVIHSDDPSQVTSTQ